MSGNAGKPFDNPWQARAFALAVALNEAGHLDWPSWTQLLGTEIAKAGVAPTAEDGEAYYRCWVAALEKACETIEHADKAK
jgi:nitrile hydratase accessory protein